MTVHANGPAPSGAPEVDAEHPWPGLAPFAEDLSKYFHGRGGEIAALLRLIQRETLTVLFGQSGLGKTSLLLAGLFPVLRESDYWPIYFRLDQSSDSPDLSYQVREIIGDELRRGEIDGPFPESRETLWEYFHRRDVDFWNKRNRLVTPVLVFDQFEEFFTLGRIQESSRRRGEAFLTELTDLVENHPPRALADRLKQASEEEVSRFDFRKPGCKVVVSLREDYLPEFEGLRTLIQNIMRHHMRMTHLTGTQALEAVEIPGRHLLDDSVAESIVRFVAKSTRGQEDGAPSSALKDLEVEPPLLSLICSELNNRRLKNEMPKITAELLKGDGPEILADYYDRSMSDVSPATRQFVENHLLTKSGFRDSMALETALAEAGVTAADIDKLVCRRLLRREDRRGTSRIELTHDVLAAPVRVRRDQRQQREKLAEAEAAQEAIGRQLANVRRQHRTTIIAICAVLMVVGAFLAAFLNSRAAAHRETQQALKREKAALADAQHAAKSEGKAHADAVAALDTAKENLGRALTAEKQAQISAETSRQTLAFLESIFAIPDAAKARGPSATADEILNNAVNRVDNLKGNPVVQAMLLETIGNVYRNFGMFDRAEPLLERSLENRKQELGEESAEYADSLTSLGLLLQAEASFQRAKTYFEQALAIRKKVLGDQHPDTAAALANLASLYEGIGNYSKAEELIRQSQEIRKESLGARSHDDSLSLTNLAGLYLARSEYSSAEPLLRRAIAIQRSALGSTHPAIAQSLENLGVVYEATGDYAKAEPLFRQALEIRMKVLGTQHLDTANSFNKLAELYQLMGDYAKAEPLLREALEINKRARGENHPEMANSLSNLAGLYESMKEYAKAEPLYRQALAIEEKGNGKVNPRTATLLASLARLCDLTERSAEAEGLLRHALAITREIFGEQSPKTATILDDLGSLLENRREYAQAVPLLEEALQIRRRVLGDSSEATAQSLNRLGIVYCLIGDYGRAMPLLRQSLEVSQSVLARSFGVLSERQQLAFQKKMRFYLDTYISFTESAHLADDELFRFVLACKGGVTAHQFRVHDQIRRPGNSELLKKLQEARTRLANIVLGSPAPNQREKWQTQVAELSDQKEALERELAAKIADLRNTARPAQADLGAILPPKTVLLDFLEYTHFSIPRDGKGAIRPERRLIVFIVRPHSWVRRIDLGPAAPIAAAVQEWRRILLGPQAKAPATEKSAIAMRQLIWKPAEPFVEDAETVLISPDGAVSFVPFASLPGKTADTYLIEDQAIATIPVPQLLPEILGQPGRPPAEPSLLLVGDPDFDASGGELEEGVGAHRGQSPVRKYRRLPGTRAEVEQIAQLFRKSFPDGAIRVLTGSAATETAVTSIIADYRWLHFATISFAFVPDLGDQTEIDPRILTGLVLAGANRPIEVTKDDGFLTALEVTGLDLRRTELVVLSSCETGLGRPAAGEGLLGLQRAFQVGGARSVVASLSVVSDQATAELMQRFYTNLWQRRMSKAEALRRAQVSILKESRRPGDGRPRGLDLGEPLPKRRPLMDWAAFVLSGDWR